MGLRKEEQDAGGGRGQHGHSDCQDELAEIGAADFIDEYGADVTDRSTTL